MLTFETINELTLKVTCTGNDVLSQKPVPLSPVKMPEEKITDLKKFFSDHRAIWARQS